MLKEHKKTKYFIYHKNVCLEFKPSKFKPVIAQSDHIYLSRLGAKGSGK